MAFPLPRQHAEGAHRRVSGGPKDYARHVDPSRDYQDAGLLEDSPYTAWEAASAAELQARLVMALKLGVSEIMQASGAAGGIDGRQALEGGAEGKMLNCSRQIGFYPNSQLIGNLFHMVVQLALFPTPKRSGKSAFGESPISQPSTGGCERKLSPGNESRRTDSEDRSFDSSPARTSEYPMSRGPSVGKPCDFLVPEPGQSPQTFTSGSTDAPGTAFSSTSVSASPRTVQKRQGSPPRVKKSNADELVDSLNSTGSVSVHQLSQADSVKILSGKDSWCQLRAGGLLTQEVSSKSCVHESGSNHVDLVVAQQSRRRVWPKRMCWEGGLGLTRRPLVQQTACKKLAYLIFLKGHTETKTPQCRQEDIRLQETQNEANRSSTNRANFTSGSTLPTQEVQRLGGAAAPNATKLRECPRNRASVPRLRSLF